MRCTFQTTLALPLSAWVSRYHSRQGLPLLSPVH
jgi:hypothetical protein